MDSFFFFTVIRLEGMRLIHPQRSWRPIVTVEIDEHNAHETILGIDGQSINQKEMFTLCVVDLFVADAYLADFLLFLFFSDQATLSSVLKVDIWYRSQSKKKCKKRNLIASGCHSLGQLLKIQEQEQSKFSFCHVSSNGS